MDVGEVKNGNQEYQGNGAEEPNRSRKHEASSVIARRFSEDRRQRLCYNRTLKKSENRHAVVPDFSRTHTGDNRCGRPGRPILLWGSDVIGELDGKHLKGKGGAEQHQ